MSNLIVTSHSEKKSDGTYTHTASVEEAKLSHIVTTIFSGDRNVTGTYKALQLGGLAWLAMCLGNMTGGRELDPLTPVKFVTGK